MGIISIHWVTRFIEVCLFVERWQHLIITVSLSTEATDDHRRTKSFVFVRWFILATALIVFPHKFEIILLYHGKFSFSQLL
jgi:hypothetical protein